MKNQVKANNAMEAKVITDKYLLWLSPKRCAKMFGKGDVSDLGILASSISYRIGASAYYYGIECKHFCSEVIRMHIINAVIALSKANKETV